MRLVPCPCTHRVKRLDCRSSEESSSLFRGAVAGVALLEVLSFRKRDQVGSSPITGSASAPSTNGRSPAFQAANTGSTPVGVTNGWIAEMD